MDWILVLNSHPEDVILANDLTTPLRGTISTVSRRGNAGVVTLDEPRHGLTVAVINPETKGRIALMNKDPKGHLPKGARVIISEAERLSNGFIALQIAQA